VIKNLFHNKKKSVNDGTQKEIVFGKYEMKANELYLS
jgi:hypothetical protein